jgi:hypothetical protein
MVWHTRTHFMAVSAEGGIAYSQDDRDLPADAARSRVERWCAEYPAYRLRVDKQRLLTMASEWTHGPDPWIVGEAPAESEAT